MGGKGYQKGGGCKWGKSASKGGCQWGAKISEGEWPAQGAHEGWRKHKFYTK